MKKIFVATLLPLFVLMNSASATNVAVIDSGLDVTHPFLITSLWKNTPEYEGEDHFDDDENGLIDDIFGYNFEQDNNDLIDLLNNIEFMMSDYEYFELQDRVIRTKQGLDNLPQEEVDAFGLDNRRGHAYEFGHKAHGTHVSGIIAKENPLVNIMGIKKGNRIVEIAPYIKEIKNYQLKNVALGDVEDLEETVLYLKENNIRVANGSFGTPYEAVINRFLTLRTYGHHMSEIKYISRLYQIELLKAQEETLSLSPKTLFVFAAGNSGYNNDTKIFTPANVQIDNALTVAATIDRSALADFSCYGEKTVHIAAPGVGILSTVPGDLLLKMSGTSQAAPFVTRVASLVLDVNSDLKSVEVKRILIETVDKKDFLKGKVSSGGIVNEQRAIEAARLSKDSSLEVAIQLANITIPDEL